MFQERIILRNTPITQTATQKTELGYNKVVHAIITVYVERPQYNLLVRNTLATVTSKSHPFPTKCPHITMSKNREEKDLLHLKGPTLIWGNRSSGPHMKILRLEDVCTQVEGRLEKALRATVFSVGTVSERSGPDSLADILHKLAVHRHSD